jgi:hypothetical protein
MPWAAVARNLLQGIEYSRRRISMNKLKFLALALFLSTGFAALTACEEGPFEEAGEEVDDAADELGDAVD